jgi:hypothetical protein
MNKLPPDVAVSIANLRLEADHAIKADIPYASARPSDILAVCDRLEQGEAMNDPRPPPDLAEAIAICKEYTSDYGRDTIISDAIDAVCAAAEAAAVEGYTAAEWKGYADQWATEHAKWRQRAEQAEAELATAKATIELLNGRSTKGSELFQGLPKADRIEKEK